MHHHGHGGYDEPVLDTPPNGMFSTVDCKWKEVLKVPVDAIQQVTKACSTQRHMLRDKGKKSMQTHPNICEDFHEGYCSQGPQCKLFHLKRSWLEHHRRPHQEALEVARQEFLQIQKEKRSFTVFCPSLKETLPVPAHYMHFTRGLFLREEERAKRQAQHGGKHTESHQNPSVCQLFIKGGGERLCKWGELCNQAHPNKEWLAQRHDMSVKYVDQCKKGFLGSSDDSTWDALDPDTNERLTIPKQYLCFTRGLFSKEFAANRVASICMLYLKHFDGACDGSGCTAGELCNQVHVDLNWITQRRVELHVKNGDYDEARHNPHHYQGVHFPAGRRAAKWQKPQHPHPQSTPQHMLRGGGGHHHPQQHQQHQWWSRSPHSDAASMLSGSSLSGMTHLELMSSVTSSLTPPNRTLDSHSFSEGRSDVNKGSFESKASAFSASSDAPRRVANWFPPGGLRSGNPANDALPVLVNNEPVWPQAGGDAPPLLGASQSKDGLDEEDTLGAQPFSVLDLLDSPKAAAGASAAPSSFGTGSHMGSPAAPPAAPPAPQATESPLFGFQSKSPLLNSNFGSAASPLGEDVLSGGSTFSPPKQDAVGADDEDDGGLNLEALASMISTLGEAN
eukprot:TRINITY_DN1895_c0_g1_i1.p1 TRINITY_DN1895_c0_g1~~TRINITY_DN1895_c0_g1_i1.p1  ORF type:complete len:686 (+),score=258.12 TRINITY_DN1895_c0_g1_i1:204-2060(+)